MNGRGSGDRLLAELGQQARDLAAQVTGPLRRICVRSGDRVLEIEWHEPPAPAPTGPAVAGTGPAPGPEQTGVTDPPAPADPAPGITVPAPMVGTFYRAAEPGGKPFVEVGEQIRSGQVIGIVEAMKLMNQIAADQAGTVLELLVADGEPVEFGQPLLRLLPAAGGGG
ncbi:acetyl-CoA carboxylase biotin carboxyl carrier protein [Micromonospora echinofusca]|uniref:Biotin carboxyl carrier protein of acetyl-CoA carboxylase n=1 Tax=Micromonospora echinofusca TaxID=47858 RepID=A0ABS3W2H2_MICEH|nr:biotin/lipoyl-containing protein [Micromonospora echinofusca]MBO4210798.1 biotin/lipoyl-binding protein [Micromonospora echinofusca]